MWLQQLSKSSWEILKKKAFDYLTARDGNHGWQQLISTLNEVRGYIYLREIGC